MLVNHSGASIDNYVIAGTTTSNYVIVEPGYHGTITLRNLNITRSSNALGNGIYSAIAIREQDEVSVNSSLFFSEKFFQQIFNFGYENYFDICGQIFFKFVVF